jgi:hypothetical protein
MSELSPSLQRNPDLDSWVRIDDGGTVTLFTGKVELGQGVRTAIARIGAEELDVSLARIRVQTADTAHGPNELLTVGSGRWRRRRRLLRGPVPARARGEHLGVASTPRSTTAPPPLTDRTRNGDVGGKRSGRVVTGAAEEPPTVIAGAAERAIWPPS